MSRTTQSSRLPLVIAGIAICAISAAGGYGLAHLKTHETMAAATTTEAKGKILFGLHKSKRALMNKGSAIVCEGQIDLITAFENGVTNVVASQGTAFTDKQAHLLKRFVEEVVVSFDADAAGEKAAEKSLIHLLAENLVVRVIEMPPGEDPDTLIRGRGAAAFLERVTAAKDFFDYQLDRESAKACAVP